MNKSVNGESLEWRPVAVGVCEPSGTTAGSSEALRTGRWEGAWPPTPHFTLYWQQICIWQRENLSQTSDAAAKQRNCSKMQKNIPAFVHGKTCIWKFISRDFQRRDLKNLGRFSFSELPFNPQYSFIYSSSTDTCFFKGLLVRILTVNSRLTYRDKKKQHLHSGLI